MEMTNNDFDAMAKEYEDGTWEGCGEPTMGRPKLYDEDLETVSFRLARSRIAAVDAATRRAGISKSEFYRRAVDRELAALS
ncbi:toxin-antitoxin system antitoxin subunit [Rubneribacter sp.]|nr:toxin-antitoxin system antitoxin subunit [Candidatus Rubneribacter avistercoris]